MIHKEFITLNDTIMQRPGIVASDMNGETVLFSINNGKYYNLGESGGEIWELIKEPILIKQIIETLAKEYEVAHAQCESEALSFLEQLHKEDLIQCSS